MTAQLTTRDQARSDIYLHGPGDGFLRRFINGNRRLAAAIERRLAYARDDLYRRYDRVVADHVHELPGGVVADIGGGRHCSFAHLLPDREQAHLVAVDVSAEELAFNREVDETRVADVSLELPFEDGSVALVASRTLLEHVNDVEAFIRHSSRVLRDGGYSIHLVPCRNAPFAVIARLVPFGVAKWLLHFLRPETSGWVEFPVFYDKCTFSAMRDAMLRAGFREVETSLSYYQSDYYDAFLPAYLLSVAYEKLVRALGLKDLAAYMLVIARK